MLKIFKIVALLEGISFLGLLANMILIKPNDIVLYKSLLFPIGMAHGVLFISYVYLAFMNYSNEKWKLIDLAIILLGSLLPFGTFYIERKYLKNA